ncbi:sn-glycerol 3-phosphate transport system substrate-binding protein [Deinobacterium chartae]|uniref:sn-glycerol 3-phosphate transport system substrate-binding protein n=1 Tax=Deinobacterium chartae TaxID=521158 RepID=A0A841HZG7_9DEIO|nr:ABC transporter substrate-binding protein [Deinobacterium chartae]MBB6097282.1 sn-glycerol 3-phosphate transport system substrate-binding protein [Deinobacterium chartae]
MFKRAAVSLALCVSTSALAAPIQIEVWSALSKGYGQAEFEEFAKDYSKLNPEVQVKVVYSGSYDDTLKKAQAAVAARKAPNVVMFEQTHGAGFVDAKAVLPLNDLIAADKRFNLKDFHSSLLSTCRYGDALYCLPFNTSTPVVYYNADLFKAAGLDPVKDFPRTWGELERVAPKLTKVNAKGVAEQWALGLYASPGWIFDAYLGQAGGNILSPDRKSFAFAGRQGISVMNVWKRMADNKSGKFSSNQYADFFSGKQAMIIASTAALENNFRQAKFNMKVAPLWCGVRCYAPIGGANLYLMNTGSEAEKKAAFDFMKYVTSAEVGAKFGAATGYMAPRRSSMLTKTLKDRFAKRPEARVTYDQMRTHGFPRTLVPFYNEVDSAITTATEEVLIAKKDPKAALEKAAAEGNRLMKVYAR